MDQFKFSGRRFRERKFWYLDDMWLPANVSNDDAFGEFYQKMVSTIWHYYGGCVMEEVVDAQWGAGHQGRRWLHLLAFTWDQFSGHGHDARPVRGRRCWRSEGRVTETQRAWRER
ncbi:hypothetical protein AMTR_s00028p00205540 [Amborella trichopoda]|uniref:Uncharacterized protein n=1 Tax=Amborella trichopoda TaxID=13333 RepID=W1PTM6_AMBTC|nr:hypothetical protein AMTR_s00028p00205540 [Amborella trichopoda]